MNRSRQLTPRRTRRQGQTPFRRNQRQVPPGQNNENGGSGSNDTPNILQALLPMFRMQRQLLELSRNFCQRMRDKLERAEEARKQELADSKPEKWVSKLQLPGVRPEDINVTINEDNLVVSSRENSSITKTLNLPSDVNGDAIKTYFEDDDFIVFEAPFKTKKYCTSSSQTECLVNSSQEDLEGTVTFYVPIEPFIENPDISAVDSECPSSDNDKDDENVNNIIMKDNSNSLKNSLDVDTAEDVFKTEQGETSVIGTTTDARNSSSKGLCKPNTFKFDFNMIKLPEKNVLVSVTGHTLMINAEIEEKHDDINCTEIFQRRYNLPDNIDVQQLKCMRKKDGSLHVRAPYLDSTSD